MTASRIPVVFIHGLWLHASSWNRWLDLYRDAGYEPIAPGWPGEPDTVQAARENPDLVADTGIDDAAAHFAEIIGALDTKPIIIGHSFGGLLAEKLLGQDLAAAAVAIDPAQIKGVLPLPLAQIRAALPVLGNPANLHKAISLTAKQFRFGFGNELSEEESDDLYEQWSIPAPARPLFQAAAANFVLHSEAKVNTANQHRGPLLLISGKQDHTVPDVTTRSTLKQYRDSTAVTQLRQFEGRGHSLTIDSGWREVADATLEWLLADDRPIDLGRSDDRLTYASKPERCRSCAARPTTRALSPRRPHQRPIHSAVSERPHHDPPQDHSPRASPGVPDVPERSRSPALVRLGRSSIG